jgi:hypothetical protein
MIIPGVGEESPDPLQTDTRDLFHHYYPRTADRGHSLRRPRPTPPPAGVPRSGFNEYRVFALPSPSACYYFLLYRFMVLASTAMSATCLSSIVLGSFMCFLVVLCRKLGRDPGAAQVPATSLPVGLCPSLQITSHRPSRPAWAISSP